MLIKVCGMIYPDNIHQIAGLHPDFMGFELFPSSPRYAGNSINLSILEKIPGKTKKSVCFLMKIWKQLSEMSANMTWTVFKYMVPTK